MALQRYGLVLAGLLIAALVLAAPVLAAHTHPAPGTFNLTTAPGPASASPGPLALDASTRAAIDAAAAGDMSALVPASTVFESVHPGDSLQDAIGAAAPGSTLYLDPGIYYEHDLIIDKTIVIRANETLGGTASNTIIDARGEGRIFNADSGLFFIDNLTLRNGYVSGDGGAISATGGLLLVSSSVITNCTATGDGGAIYSDNGLVTVVAYSAISRCTAGNGDGGAIYADDLLVAAGYTTFSDCSAPNGWGGAIEADSPLMVLFSTFTRCSAIDGGALDLYNDGTDVVVSSFTDCTASNDGGAIWADGGPVWVAESTFTRCSADAIGGAIAYGSIIELDSVTFTGCSAGMLGGAIATPGDIVATGVIFQGCSAGIDGGAVIIASSTADFMDSTFTGCSASRSGGAIEARNSDLTLTASTITGCSAVDGGAITTEAGTTEIHFSRVYGNTASGTGPAINTTTAVDATNTWWGSNSDPVTLMNGPVTYDPWLMLGITADPASITVPQTSYIRTNLTYNSDGTNTAGGGIYLPDAITNSYAVVSGPGIVTPATAGSVNGAAQGTFITSAAGTATIAGTVDGQTVYVTLDVAQGTWTPAPTEVPNDDDWPQVGAGASGGGGSGSGGSAAMTGSSGFPLMTVTVNIGGDSKAWQTIVTGTKLSDLIVTGTVQHGAGDNVTAPPGITFQYISLVPARYDTITKSIINFTVPQSWLDENHIDPKSIVLYRQTANGWEALPTTVLSTKDGTVFFSAESAGFSLFAIAGTPTVLTPPGVAVTQEPVSTPAVQEQVVAPAAVAKAPVTTQTTAPPASSSVPAGSSPFPVVPALIGLCCVGLIGGGWYIRRWWIRRQNPALFREYD